MEKLKQLFTDHYVIPEEWLWVIFGVVVLLLLFLTSFVQPQERSAKLLAYSQFVHYLHFGGLCVRGVYHL